MSATTTPQIGDRVVVRGSHPGTVAIVVDLPDETAEEFYVAALGKTLAEAYPQHGRAAELATVVAVDELDRRASGWRALPIEDVARRVRQPHVRVQTETYPIGQLSPAGVLADSEVTDGF